MALTITQSDIPFLKGSNKYWVYNGIDCLVTHELSGVLLPRIEKLPETKRIYEFEMGCQAAALTMMLRGAAFDETACKQAIAALEAEEEENTRKAAELIGPLWDQTERRKGKCQDQKPHRWSNSVVEWRKHCADQGIASSGTVIATLPSDASAICVKCGCPRLSAKQFNPRSPEQVKHLLYELLNLPTQYSRKGERQVTVDEEALENLLHKTEDEEHRECIRAIAAVKKIHKQIGFLHSQRSCDGRLRQSVNVGATETARWSASQDPFRQGTNFQNIADKVRHVIQSDPGLWLLYADLEQAESRVVANDAEDEGYIAAHDGGDVHTAVTKEVWPELFTPEARAGYPPEWTDRDIAEQRTWWDPDHEYRYYAKHVQHGGNIGQSARGMAIDCHIPVARAEEVYDRMYGQAYARVRARQLEIKGQIAESGVLVSPLGRRRQFFGRLSSASTQREGLSFTQQSVVADILDSALASIHRELDLGVNDAYNHPKPSDPSKIWLLAQIHDAILALIRPHDIPTLKRVIELMSVPTIIRGRRMVIPVDVKLGQNFRHFDKRKPETVGGLAGWKQDGERIIIFNRKEDLR